MQKVRREIRHQAIDALKLLERSEEYDPEVTLRCRESEPRAIDAKDPGGTQQPKHVVFVSFSWRQRQPRHCIKASSRRHTRHAGHRAHTVACELGARLQLGAKRHLMR